MESNKKAGYSEDLDVYSIHRFSWVFQENLSGVGNTKKKKELSSVLKLKTKASSGDDLTGYWKKVSMNYKDYPSDSRSYKDNFMLYQYLSKPARNIYFPEAGKDTSQICKIWEYVIDKEKTAEYVICHRERGVKKEWKLDVLRIELHLYDTFNVGVLTLHAVNRNYRSIEDIKKINDYGRRVCIPFIPEENQDLLCADSLSLNINGKIYETNFYEEAKKKAVFDVEADFLKEILFGDKVKKRKSIKSVIDDRMFVMCLIRDDYLSKLIQTPYDELNEVTKDLLYSIVHIDPEAPTCQDSQMRDEILKGEMYTRWRDWGTLHAATEFSLICITGESNGIDASVVRPYIVEYSYMVSLVLAQRASIMLYDDEAGKLVGKGKRIKSKELIELQERYISYKNQMQIIEFSPQEQGIELYRQIQKCMNVIEEQEILDDQLEHLYEISNVTLGNRIGKWGLVFAIAALLVDALNINGLSGEYTAIACEIIENHFNIVINSIGIMGVHFAIGVALSLILILFSYIVVGLLKAVWSHRPKIHFL